jgi:hypothetical protein
MLLVEVVVDKIHRLLLLLSQLVPSLMVVMNKYYLVLPLKLLLMILGQLMVLKLMDQLMILGLDIYLELHMDLYFYKWVAR